jgi:hypothetical protein
MLDKLVAVIIMVIAIAKIDGESASGDGVVPLLGR